MEHREHVWSSNSSYASSRELLREEIPDDDRVVRRIQPPQTPQEPMEFLARSWSLSASEISKALLASSGKKRTSFPEHLPETCGVRVSGFSSYPLGHHHNPHGSSAKRWFGARGCSDSKKIKKERARADRAQMHAAVSVAAVAAAVAALATETSSWNADPRMHAAMASATELIASHLAEIAEQSGADHELLASTVRSAVGVRSSGGLTTLTAAAATALRGAAAMRMRVQRDARSNATVIPFDRGHCSSSSPEVLCKEGDLLKRTRRGARHMKHVSIHINKNSQVMAEVKGRRVAGAFCKKLKCIVYDVYDDIPTWTRTGRNSQDSLCNFGLTTSHGSLEFECKNEIEKHKWVNGIRNLLNQVALSCRIEQSLELLSLS